MIITIAVIAIALYFFRRFYKNRNKEIIDFLKQDVNHIRVKADEIKELTFITSPEYAKSFDENFSLVQGYFHFVVNDDNTVLVIKTEKMKDRAIVTLKREKSFPKLK
ncbi:hypothetical protein [Escherichia coli]|uniref:hypothetical protein n=1 Tax=Escherichia coli TaxID=562 RepID=UPI002B2FA08C|nr:hypothetical protein VEE23_32720 [Escherichia coli]